MAVAVWWFRSEGVFPQRFTEMRRKICSAGRVHFVGCIGFGFTVARQARPPMTSTALGNGVCAYGGELVRAICSPGLRIV